MLQAAGRTVPLPRFLVCVPALIACLVYATGAEAQSPAPTPPKSPTPAAIERQLTDAVKRNPSSFAAHHALGELYIQRGKLQAAIPHLERARDLDPAHYANGYDLSLAYLETGRLDAARGEVARLLRLKDTGELHNLLGDVEERAGNLVGAAAEYQRAAHLEASDDHLFDWGNNLLALRAFEPATDVFAAGVVRHPKSARLHIGLGIAQYSRGLYEAAVTSFCRAADLAPSDPRPYQFLGEMYGVWPDASGEVTKRLARFVAAQPRHAPGQYYYAMSLWKGQGGAAPVDLARVETLLRRATALDARLAKAFLQLGILLSEQRRWREAVPPLQRAVALEPDAAQSHFRLAQAYQRTGQADLAARELEIFEKLKARESTPAVPK
jgi:Flp pilus assembly protein TadD